MAGYLIYGALNAGIPYSQSGGSIAGGFEENRVDVRPDWCWQRRSAKTWRDRNAWVSLWPSSRVIGGGVQGEYGPIQSDGCCSGAYEPFSCDGEGTQTLKWILGRVEDASGVAIDSATVRAYRASDNAFAGQGVSRADGSYVCPTPYAGVNHYIVAYKAGSPDIAGTTVNTLVPTNIDGS